MSPTIFTRLRNRFSSIPTAIEASKPSPDEEAKDLEVLQKAIGDAVTAALNNDDFTTKVASHLASQIQPSIKTALDISALESKLLASNEQLNQITTSIDQLGSKIKALQEQVASPDISLLSSHTTKLDTIATGLLKLQEEGPAPVGAALSSHSTKLDSIVAELAAIKDDIESSTAESNNGLSDVSMQVEKVIEAVESQNTTLAEIKAADKGRDILAGISTSNESHAAHTNALDEIKTTSASTIPAISELKSQLDIISTALPEIHATTASTAPSITDLKSQIDALNATLSEMKAADSSSDILAGIKVSNESHTAHATVLNEIKSINEVTAPSIDDLKSQLETINTTLSEIRTADATSEILANVKASNESHAAHGARLKNIETTVSTPATVTEKVDLTTLDAAVQNISASSAETLAEVKLVKSLIETMPAPATTKDDEILTEMKSVKSMIEAVPAPPTVKDDQILTEVKSVKSLVEALPAPTIVKDDELLTQVKALKLLVEKNAVVTKVEEVGENDKAAEDVKTAGENGIKTEENGVNVEGGEVEAPA